LRKVKVLCPSGKQESFALAGFDTETYDSTAEAGESIRRALEDRDASVLVIDEALVALVVNRIARAIDDSDEPLFLPIPMGVAAGMEREYLERVIRRIVGYQVRLK
jgi:vacuolar-type H+-ATPase subunit F/Vma7